MDIVFYNAVIYMFRISIILISALTIDSKAEIPTGYFSSRNYTWTAARDSCKMIGLFDHIQVPDTERQLAWVDAYAKYSPWFEYKDCFYVKPQFIDKHTSVTYGNQLQQCLHFCEDYKYIGLQQTSCSCLSFSSLSVNTVKSACKEKETCYGDKYAYCSYRVNDSIHQNSFVVYKKGNISGTFNAGDCLSVSNHHGNLNNFIANPCETMLHPFCTASFSIMTSKHDWISSFKQCSQSSFASYDMYKKWKKQNLGDFWLANIRRPIIHHFSDAEPKYCIAVIIQKGNHEVFKYVRPCTEELPVVCSVTDIPSSDRSKFHILLIVLIIAAVLLVTIIIAVIVLYKRRNLLRSRNRQLVIPSTEETYAQVNKPTKEKAPVHAGEPTRNNTADDSYDYMEHHRLSQNQIPTESNYDTMQSVENEELENDYDVTSGTDSPRQIVVDDTAEYSHVEAVNQEPKDVAT